MSPDLIVLSKIAKKIALCTDEKSMKETVSKIAELGKDLIESASFSLWNLIISDLSTTSKSPCEVFQFLDQIFTVLHDINYQHYYHGFFPRKYKPYFMRSLITSRIESFDSFLDCVSKREPSFLLMSWLEEDEHFISQIMGKIETVNKVRILWILKYGLWERIPELLLKRRPEIFDDSEFLNTFLEIFEGFFEHVGILDVFSKDTLNEIMSVLVNSENDSLKRFLDTILRLAPIGVSWWVNDNIKAKIASNPVFQQGIVYQFEKDFHYVFESIIDFSRFSEFTQSLVVSASIKKQQERILKEIRGGFYFAEMDTYYPWDLFWILKSPCFNSNSDSMEIMRDWKPYVAYACYMEEYDFEGSNGGTATTKSDEVIGKIVGIPLFLNDQDIQLGIAHALRTDPEQIWALVLESEDFMRSNPLILAALQAPISEDSIKSLLRQIRESKVPLLTIQEVLAYKQFRKRAVVMKEIGKRIPEIVTMIGTAKPNTDEDDWRFDLVSLILYLVEDENIMGYPEIRRAIEKRLSDFQQSTGYYIFQDELYEHVITKLAESKQDSAGEIWARFPNISSLFFMVDEDELMVCLNVPDDVLDHGRIDWEYRIDLVSLIRELGRSGGAYTVKILLILLRQLMEQVQHSTYVYAKIAGGYSLMTPEWVECSVLGWIIVEFRNNHDSTVVKSLIDVLEQTSDYTREGLSGEIVRILSHYMSSDELTALKKKYHQGIYED